MNEEDIKLLTAIPVVKQTKLRDHSWHTEVRAEDTASGMSVHYQAGTDEVPRVRENVLVAILQGLPEGWLALPREMEIAEAISVAFPSRRMGEKPTELKVFQAADSDHIVLRLGADADSDVDCEAVALAPQQGVVLAAVLLGILRRLL